MDMDRATAVARAGAQAGAGTGMRSVEEKTK